MLDPERKFKKCIFLVILYNYDCTGTNKIALNLFTQEKSIILVPDLRPGNLSRGTDFMSRGEWF